MRPRPDHAHLTFHAIERLARQRGVSATGRTSDTTRGDAGGKGLGLPIVASVARAHGRIVGVESSPAAGTTFTVELPITS